MKTDIERGPFGAWAFHTRDILDVSVEEVAERLRYHPASLRKMESGSAPASRRMRRELPELYKTIAREKGIQIAPAPFDEPVVPDIGDLAALIAALSSQTEALNRLADRLGDRSSEDLQAVAAAAVEATLRGLAAQGRLVAPAGRSHQRVAAGSEK